MSRDYPEDYPVVPVHDYDGPKRDRDPTPGYDGPITAPPGHQVAPPTEIERKAWEKLMIAYTELDKIAAKQEQEPVIGPTPERVPGQARPGAFLASLSSAERKKVQMFAGLLAYFPDALALVARHSVRSNEKHNPGEPVHWSRGKSADQDECIIRHSVAVACDPEAKDDGQYETVCRAWRALAALQDWAEKMMNKYGEIA